MSDPADRLKAALSDQYTIERELGQGGMATVYLAQDLKHGRKVALKVLKPELAAVVGAERFLAEIKTTANLQHPHILPLFDSGDADGLLFYVMPYVEGETLRDRLDRERQLAVEEALRIAIKVAAALEAAHQAGVIHRDIKPANILLAKGEPLVADFGIALVAADDQQRLTRTGVSLGTPHYMSPEQATNDGEVGSASDVYSLGCVLYEMLTGDPPFTGSHQAVVAKMLTDRPTPVRQIRATTPEYVEAAIGKALQRAPSDRFRSAQAFAEALGAGQPGAGVVRRPTWFPANRARGIGVGIAAGAFTFVILGVTIANLTARGPRPPYCEWLDSTVAESAQTEARSIRFVSCNLASVPLADVLQEFSDSVDGVSFTIAPGTVVSLTARLDRVQWDIGLQQMLQASGLLAEQDDAGVLTIRPRPEDFTTYEIHQVRFADPKRVVLAVQPLLSEFGTVTLTVDSARVGYQGLLHVRDRPELMPLIRGLLEEVDYPRTAADSAWLRETMERRLQPWRLYAAADSLAALGERDAAQRTFCRLVGLVLNASGRDPIEGATRCGAVRVLTHLVDLSEDNQGDLIPNPAKVFVQLGAVAGQYRYQALPFQRILAAAGPPGFLLYRSTWTHRDSGTRLELVAGLDRRGWIWLGSHSAVGASGEEEYLLGLLADQIALGATDRDPVLQLAPNGYLHFGPEPKRVPIAVSNAPVADVFVLIQAITGGRLQFENLPRREAGAEAYMRPWDCVPECTFHGLSLDQPWPLLLRDALKQTGLRASAVNEPGAQAVPVVLRIDKALERPR